MHFSYLLFTVLSTFSRSRSKCDVSPTAIALGAYTFEALSSNKMVVNDDG